MGFNWKNCCRCSNMYEVNFCLGVGMNYQQHVLTKHWELLVEIEDIHEKWWELDICEEMTSFLACGNNGIVFVLKNSYVQVHSVISEGKNQSLYQNSFGKYIQILCIEHK